MPVYHTELGPVEMLEWGDGPDLFVLLHAAAAGPHSLAGLARALAAPGRQIVAPALSGYGGTTLTGPRLAGHIAAATLALTRYPAERRVLFGHSIGGLVALGAARHADAVVLYEPIVLATLRQDVPAERTAGDWDRDLAAAYAADMRAHRPDAAVRRFLAAWNETEWADLPEAAQARLIRLAPVLWQDLDVAVEPIGALPARLTLLCGDTSPPITRLMANRLAPPPTVIPGAGHMAPVLMPAAIAPYIVAAA